VELVPPGPITADGSDQLLTFVVTDQTRELAQKAEFQGSTVDFGKLGGWERSSPGVWTCTYTAPKNSRMSQVSLSLKVKVNKEIIAKEFTIDLCPPPVEKLTVIADPPSLVRKEDYSSRLEIHAFAADGGPMDGLDLVFRPTLGTVDRISGEGNGLYRARYLPPKGKPKPAVEIISVTVGDQPESAAAFVAIPLVGTVTWEVDTGIPGAPVSMDVGSKRFGPVDADEKGIAGIPILVAPGTESALARVDIGEAEPLVQAIDLNVPQYNQLAVAPVATHFPGDGVTRYPIYMYVVDRAGSPVSNVSLQLEATLGTLDKPRHKRGGVYMSHYAPPVVHEITPITLTGSIPDQDESVDSVSFDVVPPLPAEFTAHSEPAVVGPGDADLQLYGSVTALGGTPSEELGVAFYRRDGEIPDVASVDMGTFVVWVVNEALPLGETTTIIAMAVDRYGLPVRGVELSARNLQGGGSIYGGGETDDTGRVAFRFEAAQLGGLALLEVSSGNLSFAFPMWQAGGTQDHFEFPRSGGKSCLETLDRWLPLTTRHLVGADSGADPPPDP
jgi:hypothetical protein